MTATPAPAAPAVDAPAGIVGRLEAKLQEFLSAGLVQELHALELRVEAAEAKLAQLTAQVAPEAAAAVHDAEDIVHQAQTARDAV
jgi:hypothetical protein